VSKRSPILGYNHNVRYRGLVFHVQTEDSGLLAPHLFTHLFHAGVIISTRKYVYDAGATEEAIKSLMQAQHKAVMKELRRGQFDDKIDLYLGGTPGLLPRGVVDEGAASDGAPAAATGAAETAAIAAIETGPVAAAAVAAPAAPVAAAAVAETATAAPVAPVAAAAVAETAPAAPAAPVAAPAAPKAASAPSIPVPAAPKAAAAPAAPKTASAPSIPVPAPKAASAASIPTPPAMPKAAPAAGARLDRQARPMPVADEMSKVSLAALAATAADEDIDDPLAATTITEPIAMAREPTLEEPAISLRPTDLAVDPRLPRTVTDDEPTLTAQLPRKRATTEGEAPPLAPPPQVRPYTADELYATMRDAPADSQPEITIQLEVDDSDRVPVPQRTADSRPVRRRELHDTEMTGPWEQTRVDPAMPVSDGIPGALSAASAVTPTVRTGDASGPIATAALSQRAAKAVGAASLPPARPIARPASRPASSSASRPTTGDDRRTPVPVPISSQSHSSAVQLPTPPDDRRVTAPPAEADYATQPNADPAGAPERPGQYSQHGKISSRIPPEPARDVPPPSPPPSPGRQGSTPQIPLPRASTPPPQPQRTVSTPPSAIPAPGRATPPPTPVQRAATPVPIPVSRQSSAPIAVPHIAPVPPAQPSTGPQPDRPPVMRPSTPPPVPGLRPPASAAPIAPMPASRSAPITIPMVRQSSTDMPRTRPPTPPRVVGQAAAPGLAPAGRSAPGGGGSGVVMSRPAVIVGAPPKAAGPNQRVRKAREDEGRGFGQGLISEKSLDEVILAYLSEDAEDK